MDIKGLGCTASRVLLALLTTGDSTYSELVDTLAINRRHITEAVNELREREYVQLLVVNSKGLVKIHVTLPSPVVVGNPREMCIAADESGSFDDKFNAIAATWNSRFSKEQYPKGRPTYRSVKTLLRLTHDSALDVYDAIEETRGYPVKSPFAYIRETLLNGVRTDARLDHEISQAHNPPMPTNGKAPYHGKTLTESEEGIDAVDWGRALVDTPEFKAAMEQSRARQEAL